MQAKRDKLDRRILYNVAVHDKLARTYEAIHGEIFNPIEQNRLRNALVRASDAVRTNSPQLKALDFGCGSGNLSKHMLELGYHVTAADVSDEFLRLVEGRYSGERLSTFLMNGSDLREIQSDGFDLIATYSVLHHIPDYLAAIRELARVCKTGGAIFIDHEHTEEFWSGDPVYRQFRRAALLTDVRKYLRPSNYLNKLRRMLNPRHTNEGDIHVFPDDHIEWKRIKDLLRVEGFDVVLEEDYLPFRKLYRPDIYERYRNRCSDTKLMVFRKR